jgi:DNA-binding NarL/FixJ family response regulator
VELVSQVKQLRPRLTCVVLTDHIECRQAVQQAGADYSLPGGLPGEQIFEAIQQALDGA